MYESELSKAAAKLVEEQDKKMVERLQKDSFTIKQLEKLVSELEYPKVFINQKTNHALRSQIDFESSNIVISNLIPDNQAIVITKEQAKKMQKGLWDFD